MQEIYGTAETVSTLMMKHATKLAQDRARQETSRQARDVNSEARAIFSLAGSGEYLQSLETGDSEQQASFADVCLE